MYGYAAIPPPGDRAATSYWHDEGFYTIKIDFEDYLGNPVSLIIDKVQSLIAEGLWIANVPSEVKCYSRDPDPDKLAVTLDQLKQDIRHLPASRQTEWEREIELLQNGICTQVLTVRSARGGDLLVLGSWDPQALECVWHDQVPPYATEEQVESPS